MKTKTEIAVVAGTLYILVYCIILQFQSLLALAWIMVLSFPLVICWVAYTILRIEKYDGPPLDDAEFGYQED
jgi:predicted membrane chloride channel (bestrophin family)